MMRSAARLANGTRTSMAYDAAGRETQITHFTSSNTPFSSFADTYNAAGNRIQRVNLDGDVTTWTYDSSSQVLSERYTDSLGTTITTFAYDAVGNRLVENNDSTITTSVYDAANRLETSDETTGITTYTYDKNGNQTSIEDPVGDITTYTWTYENQLAEIESPNGDLVTYTYAPVNKKSDELRLSKETDLEFTSYMWDDQNIILEQDDVGTVDAEYTVMPQAYGNLISQTRDADSSFYHFDPLGSTRELTDASETVTDSYLYSVFGKVKSSIGTTVNPYQWVGKEGYYHDAESGLYSLRNRFYGAGEGRFKSEDPIGFDAGDVNLYRYVGNNAATITDPNGLAPFSTGSPAISGNQSSYGSHERTILCQCETKTDELIESGLYQWEYATELSWVEAEKTKNLSFADVCRNKCRSRGRFTGYWRWKGFRVKSLAERAEEERRYQQEVHRAVLERLLAQAAENVINRKNALEPAIVLDKKTGVVIDRSRDVDPRLLELQCLYGKDELTHIRDQRGRFENDPKGIKTLSVYDQSNLKSQIESEYQQLVDNYNLEHGGKLDRLQFAIDVVAFALAFGPGTQGLAIGLEGLNVLLSAGRGQGDAAGARVIAIAGGVVIGKAIQKGYQLYKLKANKSVGVLANNVDEAVPPNSVQEGSLVIKTEDALDAIPAKPKGGPKKGKGDSGSAGAFKSVQVFDELGNPVEGSLTSGYHGIPGSSVDDIPEIIENGLPGGGTNTNLGEHVNGVPDSAFRGLASTSGLGGNPTQQFPVDFALEGGLVVKIRGVLGWDTHRYASKAVKKLRKGEGETAILRRVPTENIEEIGIVGLDKLGREKVIKWIPNRNFKGSR
ncbi:RHS repeat domain-containing protein [Gimesia fumaroli]|uniref:tRNA(Glu)-specific nuclease WapA n=1 Tax=Gimesia fumaroli TaxID=2527976 RepID=A0A518IGG1_9PLAN|nr:RHS repeat-associated core domain-containing protein [Gimesia fumaroli]QDV52178.1 tRNA(Glu)-specific nuclease WapA precursor [Gimesia fumaroli]